MHNLANATPFALPPEVAGVAQDAPTNRNSSWTAWDSWHCEALAKIFDAAIVEASNEGASITTTLQDLQAFNIPPQWKPAIWHGIALETREALAEAKQALKGGAL